MGCGCPVPGPDACSLDIHSSKEIETILTSLTLINVLDKNKTREGKSDRREYVREKLKVRKGFADEASCGRGTTKSRSCHAGVGNRRESIWSSPRHACGQHSMTEACDWDGSREEQTPVPSVRAQCS